MKKWIFIFCLVLFSTVVMAGSAAIGDGGSDGYSAISMDGLLGNGTTAAVDIGIPISLVAMSANYTNSKTKTAVVIEKAKTGAGVIYTAGLDTMQPSKRLPLTEVGWR